MTSKMVSVSVRHLFVMDKRIKTWLLRFPAKENPNTEKALFDWPIVLQYDVKAKYRLISFRLAWPRISPLERVWNGFDSDAELFVYRT